jgi:hypothetical protein
MNAAPSQDQRSGASEPDAPEQTAREAVDHFSELKSYAAHYLAARIDLVKLSIRRAVIFAVLGTLGLIALIAVVVTAVVLALNGLALALTALFRGHAWAGYMVAGVLVLGLLGLGAWIGIRRMFGSSREATVKRYEKRLQQQRHELGGHDAAERATQQVSRLD